MSTDHELFLCKYTRLLPGMRRFVLAYVPDFHQAEDTLQEIALVLWRKWPEFDPAGEFSGWAFGVARNEVLHVRRHAARHRILGEEAVRHLTERLRALESDFTEREARLEGCLKKLPGRARQAVDLRYRQNLSSQQAAKVMGTTLNAFRILISRARSTLDECLKRPLRATASDASR